MVTLRKRQAEASRGRLVAAARTCFVENGFEATSVAMVLERVNMARGALYHYFPGGKRDLFAAVFDSVNLEFHRKRDALLAIESPAARIRAGIRLFLELCTQEEFARIALEEAPSILAGQAGPGSSYELLRIQLEEAFATQERGELDVEAAANVLYGAVRSAGGFVTSSADPKEAVAAAMRPLERIVAALLGEVPGA